MTCIVGYIEKTDEGKEVYLGCDSLGSDTWTKVVRKDSKLFRSGPFLIGYTSSYRMGQLLEYSEAEGGLKSLDPPKTDKLLHKFMVTEFADRVRAIYKAGGWLKKENEVERGGTFLIAVHGRLFIMHGDLQIGESARMFDACGSGEVPALGALCALRNIDITAKEKVKSALAVASEVANGVGPPFIIKKL